MFILGEIRIPQRARDYEWCLPFPVRSTRICHYGSECECVRLPRSPVRSSDEMECGAPGLARHGTARARVHFSSASSNWQRQRDPQTRINMPERGRILTVPLWAGMRAELINSRPALRRSCVQIYNIWISVHVRAFAVYLDIMMPSWLIWL